MNGRRHLKGVLCLVAFSATGVTSGEIYRWTDENGEVHFGDRPSRAHSSKPVELRINTYEAISYGSSSIATADEVVMYSADWCGVCKQAKRYFRQQGIPFTEYDVERSSRGSTDFRRLGGRGVPVILVGDKRMNGFSVQGFEKIYRRHLDD